MGVAAVAEPRPAMARRWPTARSVLVTVVVNVAMGIPSVAAVLTVLVLVDHGLLDRPSYEYARDHEMWQFLGTAALVVLGVLFSSVNVGLQWWLTGFRLHLWGVALAAFLLPTGVAVLAA